MKYGETITTYGPLNNGEGLKEIYIYIVIKIVFKMKPSKHIFTKMCKL